MNQQNTVKETLNLMNTKKVKTMKTRNNSPQGFKLNTGGAAVLLALGSLISAGVAQANSAAGEVLTNVVTVDYDDAGGNPQAQVFTSIDVTIDHQASSTLTGIVVAQTTDSGAALPADFTARLTNTGNGSDTYDFTTTAPSSVDSCTVGTLTANAFSAPTPTAPELGATVTDALSLTGATTISVPKDAGAADTNTRGLEAGNTITIGLLDYVIASVAEVAPAPTTLPTPPALGTTTITLTTALTADVPAGTQVGEYTTITYGATGSAGATSSGATACTHVDTITATGSTATGGNTQSTATVDFTTTVTSAAVLSIAKYVRNNTNTGKNTAPADITYAGVDYFSTGKVTANPLDILEYLVVITNASTGDATGVVFNDTLPAFTTYQAGSNAVDTDGADGGTPGTGEAFEVNGESEADNGGGIVTQSGSTIQVFPGTGGNEDTDTGGDISDTSTAPLNKSAVRYQVQVQ